MVFLAGRKDVSKSRKPWVVKQKREPGTMARSALKLALQAEKGTDIKKIKEKRRHKERVQRRKEQGITNGGAATATKTGADADEEWEDEDDEKLQHGGAGDGEDLDEGSEGDEEEEGDSPAEVSLLFHDGLVKRSQLHANGRGTDRLRGIERQRHVRIVNRAGEEDCQTTQGEAIVRRKPRHQEQEGARTASLGRR